MKDERASPGRFILWATLAVAIGAVVVLAFPVLFVVFAGILFALVLRALARGLTRVSRLPYGVALAAVVLLGLGATVGAVIVLAPQVAEQLKTLAHDLPAALDRIQDKIVRAPLVSRALGGPDGAAQQMQSAPKALIGSAGHAIGSSLEVVGGLVVIAFLGVYGAAQPATYVDFALRITPARHRSFVRRALEESAGTLTRWLLGRLVAMLFVGVTTSIAFRALHIPLALTLGILAGLLTFVEYAGAVASAVPPFVLALAQSPATAVAVLVLYTALHAIEGYVLTPLLARAAVHIPPAVTLSSQVLLGAVAGPLGLTFSTPLLVVGMAAGRAWRDTRAATDDEALPAQ